MRLERIDTDAAPPSECSLSRIPRNFLVYGKVGLGSIGTLGEAWNKGTGSAVANFEAFPLPIRTGSLVPCFTVPSFPASQVSSKALNSSNLMCRGLTESAARANLSADNHIGSPRQPAPPAGSPEDGMGRARRAEFCFKSNHLDDHRRRGPQPCGRCSR